jgi:hypothetical protein
MIWAEEVRECPGIQDRTRMTVDSKGGDENIASTQEMTPLNFQFTRELDARPISWQMLGDGETTYGIVVICMAVLNFLSLGKFCLLVR